MKGEKSTYKDLNPVESGPSVIDILHSVLTLDTFHTLIANK